MDAKTNKKETRDVIVEKNQQRLRSRKNITLSKVRKIILIQSVVSRNPIYYLSLFDIPKEEIETFCGEPKKGREKHKGRAGRKYVYRSSWEVLE